MKYNFFAFEKNIHCFTVFFLKIKILIFKNCFIFTAKITFCCFFLRWQAVSRLHSHLYNMYTTSAQRLRRCPTLYKCYTNVLCLLGCTIAALMEAFRAVEFCSHGLRTGRSFLVMRYKV